MLVVSWFICCIFSFVVYNYLFCKLTNMEFKINKKLMLFSFLMCFVYYIINRESFLYIRPYVINIYIYICFILLYKQKFMKTLIVYLCILLLSFVSELAYDVVVIFLFNIKLQDFVLLWYGYLVSNVLIYTLCLILYRIPIMKKIFSNIINWYNQNEFKSIIIFVVLCMIILTFFLYNNFIKVLPNQLLWLTNMFCIAVMFFVVNYFKEKANNNRIVSEYDQLLKYVNKYEKVVEDKSKRQHEYKNQLVLIKGMINKTNKKAIEYIDSLYEEEKDDSNLEMLKKLQYLPSGGLKGLIYYKLEDMKDKKINVFVDISPKVKNVKVNKKLDSNLKDISKVIGVYLDNAIEASVHSKEKYIVLEIYLDKDEWVFSLSNTYKGEIDLNRIDKEGYTTKGSGKGYGLSLVKDIIEHNSDLRQERELRGIYYTQKLYMKK